MSAVGKMATIRKRACALPKILTQLGFEVVWSEGRSPLRHHFSVR
jgi:hypothetical protein